MRRILTALAMITALGIPAVAFAADVEAGKVAFIANCMSCHGETGKGDGPVGALLDPPPRDFSQGDFKFDTDGDGKAGTDADIKNVVKNGALEYGGSPLMAPLVVPDADMENIIAYMRTLK